jgi:formylglycine-generating enzyme required for sulfatase activity
MNGRFLLYTLAGLILAACVSKPEPWSPDGKTADGRANGDTRNAADGRGNVDPSDVRREKDTPTPPQDVVEIVDLAPVDVTEVVDVLDIPDVLMPTDLNDASIDNVGEIATPDTVDLVEEDVCQPDCDGNECGDDGCGGSCGACDDELTCTNDSCGDDGQCVFAINDFSCVLSETCVPSGTEKPGEPCQKCDPTKDKTDWSSKGDDTPCGSKAECLEGICTCINEACGETCCDAGQVCHEAACCTPQCDGTLCGSDGCGGECACDEGMTCQEGLCNCVPGVASGNKTLAQYGMVWVEIPAGCFKMGCSAGDNTCGLTEKPSHEVTVQSFEILETEVTEGQYFEATGVDPSCDDAGGGENAPVECVNWNEAKAFCEAVDPDGRLCTEAEWEYAARGGTTTKYYCGDDPECLDDIAWQAGFQSCGPTCHKEDVKGKDPNAYGLYDMIGNIREWVEDCWHSDYDLNDDGEADWPVAQPAWTTNCTNDERGLRGSSYSGFANDQRVSYRTAFDPSMVNSSFGFRCCRSK